MISAKFQNITQLMLILLVLNIAFAAYNTPYKFRQSYGLNNQRSAKSDFRYAWFTRNIHDDMNNDDENIRRKRPLFVKRILGMKALKDIFNRRYQNGDMNLLE